MNFKQYNNDRLLITTTESLHLNHIAVAQRTGMIDQADSDVLINTPVTITLTPSHNSFKFSSKSLFLSFRND